VSESPEDVKAGVKRRQRLHERREYRFRAGREAILWSMAANVLVAAAKAVIGLLAGSTALVADAVHSLADVVNSSVTLASLFYARRPPDESHHYGHGRSEALAAVFTAALLLGAGAIVMVEAILTLRRPALGQPNALAIVVAVLVLLVKQFVARSMARVGARIHSQAVSALASDNQSDVWSAIAVILGDTLARLTGRPQLDPLAAIVVGLLIFGMGLMVTVRALSELSDASPASPLYTAIRLAVRSTPGVCDVLDVDARVIGGDIRVRADIEVDPTLTIISGAAIAEQVRVSVEAVSGEVSSVTVQLFPYDDALTPAFDHEQRAG